MIHITHSLPTQIAMPGQFNHSAFNPFSEGNVAELSALLRVMCVDGLKPADAAELEDQIEAVVPAAIELRDKGYLVLNPKTFIDLAGLEGLMSLASDQRLSELSRLRCRAMRDRMIVLGVKSLLGHLS